MAKLATEMEQLEQLLTRMGEAINVSRGETIYQPGDPSTSVCVVEAGRVKLAYLDESGKKLTLSILDAGEIFGERCLVGEKYRHYLATAIAETTYRSIKKERFVKLINSNPLHLREMLLHFARRGRQLEETLEDIVFKNIQTRLSRQLLKLSNEYGVQTKEGTLIGFQLTHKELADMIGSARENTTIALNRFQDEGILDKSRYRIVIKSEEGLREKCKLPG
jgi:CRP-like cAMP-binding protein